MTNIHNTLSNTFENYKISDQNPELLTRSLFENIEFGNIECLIEEIENADDLIFLLSCISKR